MKSDKNVIKHLLQEVYNRFGDFFVFNMIKENKNPIGYCDNWLEEMFCNGPKHQKFFQCMEQTQRENGLQNWAKIF